MYGPAVLAGLFFFYRYHFLLDVITGLTNDIFGYNNDETG